MKTVLLVEDEENLVRIIETVLRDEGYDVRKTYSAEEALDLCAAFSPDLVICDVKMGLMDGFEMVNKLKVLETTRNTPFVFLTAFDDLSSKKLGLGLGAAEYITKPFDVDHLIMVVKRILPQS